MKDPPSRKRAPFLPKREEPIDHHLRRHKSVIPRSPRRPESQAPRVCTPPSKARFLAPKTPWNDNNTALRGMTTLPRQTAQPTHRLAPPVAGGREPALREGGFRAALKSLIASLFAAFFLSICAFQAAFAAPTPAPVPWDTYSDTWVGVDDLGRALPTYEDVGPPRADRQVAIFYLLWQGSHTTGGPYDVSKILAQNPSALTNPASPLWGPLHAFHYWGEPLFGYYRDDDPFVLRKHAQMLSDAGVDLLAMDNTNNFTYQPIYMALFKEFEDVRQRGGSPPKVVFLCPFWTPTQVVSSLYSNLYEPGLYSDLWYRMNGKPLILADPSVSAPAYQIMTPFSHVPARLLPGQSLGQSFHADRAFDAAGGWFPTWNTTGSAATLILREKGPQGKIIAQSRLYNIVDNQWTYMRLPAPAIPGDYYLDMRDPKGSIGWWTTKTRIVASAQPFADGAPADAATGNREIGYCFADDRSRKMRTFFTFRKPQASMYAGPTQPNMWGWLEVSPQHVFKNDKGENEEVTAGVAQNSVDGRLDAMTDPRALGRSYHNGIWDASPGAVNKGLNFAEQFEYAIKQDPRVIFIDGWNEWVAQRFTSPGGAVRFVDQFDQEHSRDVEPMRGGHGDDYYYEMVSFIRRYKGVRPLPPISPRSIAMDGRFDEWKDVQPEFRDDIGDPVHRDFAGNGNVHYTNNTGRNDIVAAKVSYDKKNIYFYVRTHDDLTAPTGDNWMLLLLNTDGNYKTGWLGYDFIVNRTAPTGKTAYIQRCIGNTFAWGPPVPVRCRYAGNQMEIAIPRSTLGLTTLHATIDFKWADNCLSDAPSWSDFTLNGDAAPNDRLNYRAKL